MDKLDDFTKRHRKIIGFILGAIILSLILASMLPIFIY